MSYRTSLCIALFACALFSAISLVPTKTLAGTDRPIVLFAAASLKDALEDIRALYEETHPEAGAVTLSLAGSSALARQIEQGAPADLYISASVAWVDRLEEYGLLVNDSRLDLVRNELVLIAGEEGGGAKDLGDVLLDPAAGGEAQLKELVGEGLLALALVNSVPAGIYGQQALKSYGLWGELYPARITQSDNVRSALALVARREVPLGIVYRTDAGATDDVFIVATFPDSSHAPIVYPAAVVDDSRNKQAAQAFLDFLSTDASREIFAHWGFRSGASDSVAR